MNLKKYRNDRVWSSDLFFDIKSTHEFQFCFQIYMISMEKSGPVKVEPSVHERDVMYYINNKSVFNNSKSVLLVE